MNTNTPRTDAAPKVYRYRSRCSGLVYNRAESAGDCDALAYVSEDHARTLEADLARVTAERDEARRLHNELLYQVGNKYPGETRHETALRYLRNAEQQGSGIAQTAAIQPKVEQP